MNVHDKDYYKKIGFKCGLEVHQRLLTKSKLFCNCSALLNGAQAGTQIERRQRAVVGELGKLDPSTSFESERGRRFLYNTFKDTTCLVDVDEEPPHEVNPEALDVALLIAASFSAEIPDEVEPMRKEVVDGSDPSAFQRTMLIGYNAHVSLNKKKIKISSLFLEEESSGIEDNAKDSVIYNVDRLGIPLIEIDTDPEIETPEEAKETAQRIGAILRLTGKVQRGIGSIRQDVNVSIKGGARTEIKGFQELESMDAIIDSEIQRQENLIKIKGMLKERNASVGAAVEVTEIFEGTAVKIISNNIKPEGAVFASKLAGFKGIIGMEVNPNRRLGSEISDYAKIAGVKGIIHSDENLDSYGFSQDEISKIKKALSLKDSDAFMLVAASRNVAEKAINLAIYRAKLSLEGVPLETRAADPKTNSTKFLRPLPGGSRMYPETDANPIILDNEKYKYLVKNALDIDKVTAELNDKIGNAQITAQLLKSTKLQSFFTLTKGKNIDPALVATVLVEKMKELRRSGIDTESISDEVLACIFSRYKDRIITKAGIEEVIKSVPKSCNEVDSIIEKKGLVRISGDELIELIKQEAKASNERSSLINSIMSKHRFNIDGEELNELVKVVLNK